jgi:hypothetical protein
MPTARLISSNSRRSFGASLSNNCSICVQRGIEIGTARKNFSLQSRIVDSGNRNGLGSRMMSNLYIFLGAWICVNLAFVAIRLLVTAKSDDASGNADSFATSTSGWLAKSDLAAVAERNGQE